MATQVVTAHYFQKKRALAMSIRSCGTSIGIIIFPRIFRFLIETYSWRGCLLIWGAVLSNGLVFGALFRNNETNNSAKAKKNTNCCTIKSFCDHTLFKSRKFPLYMASTCLVLAGHLMPFIFLPARAQSIGISPDKASLLLSVFGITSIILRPPYGFLADKLEHHKIGFYSMTSILSGIIISASYFATNYIHLNIFVCLFALFGCKYSFCQNMKFYKIVTKVHVCVLSCSAQL